MDTYLGRHQEHDPASRNFPAAVASAVKDVEWPFHGQVLNQGRLGSCTGNAAAGCMMTGPFFDHNDKVLTEKDAVSIYEQATHLDRIPGYYPPNDTGSSGLGVAKVLKKEGMITAYHHAFGLTHALGALMLSPVLLGIPWTKDMFTPDKDGFVHPTGPVEGGHEIFIFGCNVEGQYVDIQNSWGTDWGLKGCFRLTWSDLDSLLKQGGDVTIPVV